jgi:hypothetical protein
MCDGSKPGPVIGFPDHGPQALGRKRSIEAKAKTSLASKDFAGLRAIHGLPGLDRRLIVYLGDRPQRTEDGIDVLPLGGFLGALEERSLW